MFANFCTFLILRRQKTRRASIFLSLFANRRKFVLSVYSASRLPPDARSSGIFKYTSSFRWNPLLTITSSILSA